VTDSAFGPAAPGREIGRYVRLEMREQDDLHIVGRTTATDHLRRDERGLRAGALFTFLDNVGGICAGIASLPDGWVVSTNLAARILTRDQSGPFRIESDVLRRGRNNVVTSVQIVDEGAYDTLIADGVLTSSILVPENGPPGFARPVVLVPQDDPAGSYPPIPEWLRARAIGPDAIEIDLADELRNPWGILHGGVVAMLVDLAAEHASGGVPTDVVLHFLAPNRVGPVRATGQSLGARSDGQVVRVEVRDVGADRVTAIAIATALTPG